MKRSISLMPINGIIIPPNPQISRFLRKRASAPSGRYDIPFNAMGMSAGIMSALKITAERIADVGECKCMISITLNHGRVPAKSAGMIAKYLATSLAIEELFASVCRIAVECGGFFRRLCPGIHG